MGLLQPRKASDMIKRAAARTVALFATGTDGQTPATGKTLTTTVSKDGAAAVATTNTATEIGAGCYALALTAAEMTADLVVVAATATGAVIAPLVIETGSAGDEVIEGTLTAAQIQRIALAVLAGDRTRTDLGGGSVEMTFRDAASTKARVTATLAAGARDVTATDGT